MSGTPSIASVESTLQSIEKASAEIAEKATALSQFIEIVEKRLRDMPGKTEATIVEGECSLGFERHGDWGLWLRDEETESDGLADLTRVSIERKARAFPLLIQLLRQIQVEQRRQLDLINSADEMMRSALGVKNNVGGK